MCKPDLELEMKMAEIRGRRQQACEIQGLKHEGVLTECMHVPNCMNK